MRNPVTNPRESAAIADSARLSDAKRKILDRFILGRFEKPSEARPVITKRPSGEPVPLSYPQLQVWLHAQMAADVPFYNQILTVYRHGTLDRDVVEHCFFELIRRHEIWRTTFEVLDGAPVQVIQPMPSRFAIPLHDLRKLSEPEREVEARNLATKDARFPFDLKEGPLLRAIMMQTDDHEYRLYITFHHLIFDGVTAYCIFLPELAALYEAFSAGKPSPLSEPSLQYGDFAHWQRKTMSPEIWSEHMA